MKKLALFSLHENDYAISVAIVEHIISIQRIFPLPLLRDGFVGGFLYEGRVVPLFDLWQVFSDSDSPAFRECQFAVLCSTEFGLVGIPADQVVRVADSQRGEFNSLDSNSKTVAFKQVFICMGNRYPVLDVEALIASSYR